MTLKIVRTPAARIDLLDIWTYIADDSERAADKMLDRIDELLRMLADHPSASRARPELGQGLRSVVAGQHVLFCRVQGDELLLVRALSGYLDITPGDFA